jgi:hypothetical protein
VDFLSDRKNLPIVILVVVLAIGGAVASCLYFFAGPSRLSSDRPAVPVAKAPQRAVIHYDTREVVTPSGQVIKVPLRATLPSSPP